MIKFTSKLLLTSCLAAATLVAPASAADLWGPRDNGSIKDAPYEAPFSWTGFYIGGHAGLGTGDTEGVPDLGPASNFFATDYDMSGALYGGHVGYNFQTGSFVIGLEGTFSGSSINGDGPSAFLVSERDVDWIATVTGRLGYAMGRSLVYAKGGVAWADVETNVRFGGTTILTGNETHFGWTAGFGFEHALSNNISVRIEYAHIDLGSETHNLDGINSDVDVILDTVTLGVSYKF